jgi:hypothetical protein
LSYEVVVSWSVEYIVDVRTIWSVHVEVSTIVDKTGSDGRVTVERIGRPKLT